MTPSTQSLLTYGLVITIPSIIGAITTVTFVKSYKLKKLIQSTPTSKLGFLKAGFVEVCGRIALTGQKLLAPIGGNDCVYYDFRIEEWRRSGKSHRWVEVVKDVQRVSFFVEDETGRALVNLEGAETLFDEDRQVRSSGFLNESTPTALLDTIAQRYNFNRKGWIFDKKVRYRETILEPGDQIYVLGTAQVGVNEPTIQKNQGGVLLVADSCENKALKKLNMRLLGMGIASLLLIGVAVGGFVMFILSRSTHI